MLLVAAKLILSEKKYLRIVGGNFQSIFLNEIIVGYHLESLVIHTARFSQQFLTTAYDFVI